jgi:micrococcal nuclease
MSPADPYLVRLPPVKHTVASRFRAIAPVALVLLAAASVGGLAGIFWPRIVDQTVGQPGQIEPRIATQQQTNASQAPVPTQFEGRVVRVSDGDSIRVLWNRQSIPVRLAGIDAPESGQPWSHNARAALDSLVAGKTVTVTVTDRDRYQRYIAEVRVASGGQTVFVNREMLRLGAAWVYRAYNDSASDVRLETEARSARRGFWSLPPNERLPPWEYRRNQRANNGVASR